MVDVRRQGRIVEGRQICLMQEIDVEGLVSRQLAVVVALCVVLRTWQRSFCTGPAEKALEIRVGAVKD